MKTIQIDVFCVFQKDRIVGWDRKSSYDLMIALYNEILKDDPLFHFLLEPQLVIRISKEECLTQVKSYLEIRNIDYSEYPYPNAPEGKFGVGSDSIDERHKELMLPIYHINSIAALTLDEKDHLLYLERMTHTAFSSMYGERSIEANLMTLLAALKQDLGFQLWFNTFLK